MAVIPIVSTEMEPETSTTDTKASKASQALPTKFSMKYLMYALGLLVIYLLVTGS